jgi:hypothetical protein
MRVYIVNINLYHIIGALLASIAFWVHNCVPHDEGYLYYQWRLKEIKLLIDDNDGKYYLLVYHWRIPRFRVGFKIRL